MPLPWLGFNAHGRSFAQIPHIHELPFTNCQQNHLGCSLDTQSRACTELIPASTMLSSTPQPHYHYSQHRHRGQPGSTCQECVAAVAPAAKVCSGNQRILPCNVSSPCDCIGAVRLEPIA